MMNLYTPFATKRMAKTKLLLTTFLIISSFAAHTQTGVLDVTFGNKGKVVTEIGKDAMAHAIAVQQDGKFVVTGVVAVGPYYTIRIITLRYNADGTPDASFGNSGYIIDSLLDNGYANAIAVQQDGKIIVAGSAGIIAGEDFVLLRYNTGGTPDSSFGINGVVTTDFEEGYDEIYSIKIKPGGKILVAGTTESTNDGYGVAVAQYRVNGDLDSLFGNNGKVAINIPQADYQTLNALAIESNGKIVASGYVQLPERYEALVIRLLADGKIDSTFGNAGIVQSNFGSGDNEGYAMVIQKDSKIVVAGISTNDVSSSAFLLRFNDDGTSDYSFGTNGVVLTSLPGVLNSGASSMYLQNDQKIVVSGIVSDGITLDESKGSDDFLLARYNTDGSLDSTYGKRGFVTTNFYDKDDLSLASAVDKNGKIILAGWTDVNDSITGIALARYEAEPFLYYNTLKGSLYLDKNKNGIKDVAENFITNAHITIVKAGIDTISIHASNGRFAADVDTGSYVTIVTPYRPYYTAVPAVFNTSHATYFNTDSVSFALQPVSGKRDLAISIVPITPARPGFTAEYKITYTNQGTDTVATGSIVMVKNSKLVFNTAVPAPFLINGDTIRWNYTNLKPMETAGISVALDVPAAVNIGDTLRSVANILPVITDLTPVDNTSSLLQSVSGSYDPNDKTENHAGGITVSQVQSGNNLQYTIRFQNTGTDTAFNVFIRDTLNNNVDWSTLVMIASSHNFQLTVNDGKYCSWALNNINLVDSYTNEALSHGYITYSVKAKPTLVAGSVINNTAHIYFDYNLPVQTNIEKTVVQNTVLPLKLLSFLARRNGRNNIVEWVTDKELNLDYFVVERSTNGQSFAEIGKVKAGRNKYSFTDDAPAKSINYYRLKLVDKDGKYEYSSIRSTDNSSSFYVNLYPNPATERLLVQLNGDEKTNVQLQIISLDGKVMLLTKLTLQAGQHTQPVDVSTLQAGSYFLKVTSQGQVKTIIKFHKM